MGHPYHHALSSVKKWGGTAEDYLPLHQWFDESKGLCCKTDVGDSRRESSGIDGRDAQTCRTCVSHDELA